MERRPPASEIPDRPGAYLFRDRHGEVLYVGKARSLRKRLPAYFGRDLAARTRAMVEGADSVEWIVTDGEVAALMMEYNLIKEHRPRFNIRLRDDKSYPYLAITRGEEWPRATVMRGKRRRDTQYFGPYANVYAIRQTLDLLLPTFPVRTCTSTRLRRAQAEGRPCLLYHIGRCSGPCIGEVSAEDYAAHLAGLAAFLSGDGEETTARLRAEMLAASEALEYERAARLRDRAVSVDKALARQEVATLRKEDFDLFALEEDDLEVALVVLTVRRGRVTGRLATVVDKVEELSPAALMGRLLTEVYGEETPPRTVLVQALPEEPGVWEEWLAARRGGPVSLRVPQRGAKRRLLGTAQDNAAEVFARHRLQRHGDHNARARALRSLQDALGLPEPPLRIEAYDISTIQGRDTVGSMVVMEDGLPRRNQYRHFRVRGVAGQDDFAALEEVLQRRLSAYLRERERPVEERGRFAYPPSLLLVDGGAGQVSRAVQVVGTLGLAIPVAGLAKRMEEVYLPGGPEPLRIPRGEEALYLLQQVRDEAHRFAVAYHRRLRGRRMVSSALDAVPGVGPARRKALLRRFGSMARMREAEVEELTRVVPAKVAAAVHAALHAPARGAGIDLEEAEGG
jgi:excinuclease ABC subunit C